jgi:hypothetical protein
MSNKVEYLTRKALHKLDDEEIKELIQDIKNGTVFEDDSWDIVYVTTEEILEYYKRNFS